MGLSKLAKAVLDARTAADLLEALTRLIWDTDHPSKDCPANMIPTEEVLASWLSECPQDAHAEAGKRLADLFRLTVECCWLSVRISATLTVTPAGAKAVPPPRPDPLKATESLAAWAVQVDPDSGHVVQSPDGRKVWTYRGQLPVIHELWAKRPQEGRPKHPLAPIVRAWQERPTPKQPRKLTNRASLARLHKLSESDTRLPGFPQKSAPRPSSPGWLFPELAPPECPSWLLWLFDRAGGQSLAQGRGAPWPMRLWIGAVLHLDITDRDGIWHTLRFPHLSHHENWTVRGHRPWSAGTPAIERWLHPDGWANRRRDWQRLPDALDAMARDMAYVPVLGLGSVALLFPSVIPRTPSDPLVEFTIRIPAGAASGARIDWPTLCKYGTDSGGLYRAYIAAVSMMDRTAHNGHPITRTLPSALTLPDGRPKRRKGGVLARSRTERKTNPTARFVKTMNEGDLAALIGFDPRDRFRRRDARRHFERLAADGVIDFQKDGKGWRIFGPDGEVVSGESE